RVEVADRIVDVPEAHGRELRADQQLEVRRLVRQAGEEPGVADRPLDPGAERRGPMDPEREPQLQRPEWARVLERPVDRVVRTVAVEHVALAVPEGDVERRD